MCLKFEMILYVSKLNVLRVSVPSGIAVNLALYRCIMIVLFSDLEAPPSIKNIQEVKSYVR